MYETSTHANGAEVFNKAPILSAKDLDNFFSDRDGALPYIIAYLEAGEDWVLDKRGAPLEGLLISELGERMLAPPPVDSNIQESAEVLNYVRAGRMLRILEWMDANPENKIADILRHPDLDIIFKERLKKILAILTRGKLLEMMFNEKSCNEMGKALRLMEQKKEYA